MNPARFPDGSERRAAVELRAAGRRLEGYAAVFDVSAKIGGFTETVRPGAFRASLLTPGRDVLALMDHDPTRLLARSSNGSLRLAEDARGLHFEMDVPATSIGADALTLVESRLLGGASIGFRVVTEGWPAADRRELRAVDLIEISLVSAFPAYAQTTVSARSRSLVPASIRLRQLFLDTLG